MRNSGRDPMLDLIRKMRAVTGIKPIPLSDREARLPFAALGQVFSAENRARDKVRRQSVAVRSVKPAAQVVQVAPVVRQAPVAAPPPPQQVVSPPPPEEKTLDWRKVVQISAYMRNKGR
ncbi:MAG: hypothetical protein HQL56_08665 [Magnetococcales bacterium]|nr:hypothetical protein [Magnetococcales bacterium]